MIPIVKSGALYLNISVANKGTADEQVSIAIPGLLESPQSETVPALTEKTFSINLPLPQTMRFEVSVAGNGLEYSKEIILQETIAPPPEEKSETPEQGGNDPQSGNGQGGIISVSSLPSLKDIVSDETLMLAGGIAVLIALGIVLKGLISKK